MSISNQTEPVITAIGPGFIKRCTSEQRCSQQRNILDVNPYHNVWVFLSHAGKVVPECYKDDDESQWKNLKLDPRHPKTPEPMATEIGRGDYVPDIYPCAKLHYDPFRGFCPPHMRSCLPNVHSASFYNFWVLPTRYRLGRCADFDDQYVKRRRFAQGCAFWGSREQFFTL